MEGEPGKEVGGEEQLDNSCMTVKANAHLDVCNVTSGLDEHSWMTGAHLGSDRLAVVQLHGWLIAQLDCNNTSGMCVQRRVMSQLDHSTAGLYLQNWMVGLDCSTAGLQHSCTMGAQLGH